MRTLQLTIDGKYELVMNKHDALELIRQKLGDEFCDVVVKELQDEVREEAEEKAAKNLDSDLEYYERQLEGYQDDARDIRRWLDNVWELLDEKRLNKEKLIRYLKEVDKLAGNIVV